MQIYSMSSTVQLDKGTLLELGVLNPTLRMPIFKEAQNNITGLFLWDF